MFEPFTAESEVGVEKCAGGAGGGGGCALTAVKPPKFTGVKVGRGTSAEGVGVGSL